LKGLYFAILLDRGFKYPAIFFIISCYDDNVATIVLYRQSIPFATSKDFTATVTTVCEGGNTTFSVAAEGDQLSYQWQIDTGFGFVDLQDGGEYSGANTADLVITNIPLSFGAYTYRCIISSPSSADVFSARSCSISKTLIGAIDYYCHVSTKFSTPILLTTVCNLYSNNSSRGINSWCNKTIG